VNFQHITETKVKLRSYIEIYFTLTEYSDLREFFNDWGPQIFLTGGCIGSMLRNEPINDYDFYFRSQDAITAFEKFIADRMDLVKDVSDYCTTKVEGKCITANAITLKNTFQFIIGWVGHPDKVRAHFDYLHTTPYYDYYSNKLYISPGALEAIMGKKLVVFNKESAERGKKNGRYDKLIKQGFTE